GRDDARAHRVDRRLEGVGNDRGVQEHHLCVLGSSRGRRRLRAATPTTMKFVRIAIGSTIGYGTLEDDGRIRAITTTPFLPWEATDERFAQDAVRTLAPVLPSKIVAVGLNYRSHAEETGMKLPEEPMIFIKPATSVISPGEAIKLPPQSRRVDYEAELAIVIGKAARNVDETGAASVILGYT